VLKVSRLNLEASLLEWILLISVTSCVYFLSPLFPDFYGYKIYSNYIALSRFSSEQVSALILGFIGGTFDVSYFFALSIFIYGMCVKFVVKDLEYRFFYFTILFLAISFVPIFIVPRSLISAGFSVILVSNIFKSSRREWLSYGNLVWFILAFLSHNFTSLIFLFFAFFFRSKFLLKVLISLVFITSVYWVLSGSIEGRFNLYQYASVGNGAGFSRSLLFVSVVTLLGIVSKEKKTNNIIALGFFVSCVMLAIVLWNSWLNRLVSFAYLVFLTYFIYTCRPSFPWIFRFFFGLASFLNFLIFFKVYV